MKYFFQSFFILTIVISATLTSCSDLNQVLKNDDNEYKKDRAVEYYTKKEYINAATVLEDILPYYKLSIEGEKLYYYYAKSHYYMADYYLASYYLRRFVTQYPSSKYAEECVFLSAMCSVHNSPEYALDQTETLNALDQLQIFIDMYPNSSRIDTCNLLMDEMHFKLETKDYSAAKLYYDTENYKAAVTAFKNFLADYPLTSYKEDVLYYDVLSRYELAINSIESKKLDRLHDTMKSYSTFVAEFPDSDRVKTLNSVKKKTEAEIQLMTKTN